VQYASAHKRRYELLPTMKRKIKSKDGCKVQELFVKCVEAWLANPETPIIPDISTVPIKKWEFEDISAGIEERPWRHTQGLKTNPCPSSFLFRGSLVGKFEKIVTSACMIQILRIVER